MLGFGRRCAVATIRPLAVVSPLTLSTAGAIAHDVYVNWSKARTLTANEVWIARIAAVVNRVLAIALESSRKASMSRSGILALWRGRDRLIVPGVDTCRVLADVHTWR